MLLRRPPRAPEVFLGSTIIYCCAERLSLDIPFSLAVPFERDYRESKALIYHQAPLKGLIRRKGMFQSPSFAERLSQFFENKFWKLIDISIVL